MLDVVYVTYRDDPADPDPDLDLPLARAAFAAAGLSWQVVEWDDRSFDWSRAGLVLVRSAWDYARRHHEFLSWIEHASRRSRLENPRAVLLENTDKRYLRKLAAAGVGVVPTGWVEQAAGAPAVVDAQLGASADRGVVVKPHVSAGARDTLRTGSADAAVAHTRAILDSGRLAMVQPYLEAVAGEGEISVVVLDGLVTHAVRKVPALDRGGHGDAAGPVAVTDELRRAATAVLRAAGADDLLYARVDLVRGPSGSLLLMELELTEPTLFLPEHPPAAGRLAAAVARRLR